MRLTHPLAPETSPHDLTARAFAALDRRLLAGDPAPVAVAVSGGGDSMALLALACAWGRARGRPILALSVDHALQPASAAWSRHAAAAARNLGAEASILRWEGDKPTTGLSAAARAARHRLLAEAAREARGAVILMAHTADDIAESEVMRAGGSNLGEIREWSPSPAWPEGREVFLLRPLLGEGRETLRAFLRSRGLDWVEDPANADPKYARSRARTALQTQSIRHSGSREGGYPEPTWSALEAAGPSGEGGPSGFRIGGRSAPLSGMTEEVGGGLIIDRRALADAATPTARRFLAAALLSAAGTARPPRGVRLDALLVRLKGSEPVAATLAGARIQASPDEIFVTREMPRGGSSPLEVAPGSVSVWDGRFEIWGVERPRSVVAAAGHMARLSPADRKEIMGLAPIFRGSQPVLIGLDETGGPSRPLLASRHERIRALAGPRLRAALGEVAHERDIGSRRVAPEAPSSYVVAERPAGAVAN